jgi:uncharacterized protein YkwD
MAQRVGIFAVAFLCLSLPLLFGTGSSETQHPAQSIIHWWSMDRWDLSRLDTARNVDYLTTEEKDMVLALNMARSNPAQFARDIVEPYEAFFRGAICYMPGDPVGVRSQEGLAPVMELDTLLLQRAPVPILEPSPGISKAARDLVNDQGRTGQTGHFGGDGSNPHTRMNRHGRVVGSVGETNSYGDSDGFVAVLDLLVDDGEPDRGHRLGIMESNADGTGDIDVQYSTVGVAMGTHPHFGQMAVADFAGNYFDGGGVTVSFDQWRNTTLDTARVLNDIERDLILGVNVARADPDGFYDSVIKPLLAGARVFGMRGTGADDHRTVPYESVLLSSGATLTLGTQSEIEKCKGQFTTKIPSTPLAHSDAVDTAASLEMDYRSHNPGALSDPNRPQKAQEYLTHLPSTRWSRIVIDFDITLDVDWLDADTRMSPTPESARAHLALEVFRGWLDSIIYRADIDSIGVAQGVAVLEEGRSLNDAVLVVADNRE